MCCTCYIPLLDTHGNIMARTSSKEQKKSRKKRRRSTAGLRRRRAKKMLSAADQLSYEEFDTHEYPRHPVSGTPSGASLKALLRQDEIVQEGFKHFPRLRLASMQEESKQDLPADKMQDLQWAMRNCKQNSFIEMLLGYYPEALVEMKIETATNKVFAKILISPNELLETDASFDPTLVVNEASLKSGRFNDQFAKLEKYDAIEFLNNSVFASIGYAREENGVQIWNLMDSDGLSVEVTDQWIDAAEQCEGGEPILPGFLGEVKAKKGKQVTFPTGCTCGARLVPPWSLYSPYQAADFPRNRFPNQKDKCLASSICSTLHAIGHQKVAQDLHDTWISCLDMQSSNPSKASPEDHFFKQCRSHMEKVGLFFVPPRKVLKRRPFNPLDPKRRLRSLFLCKLRPERGEEPCIILFVSLETMCLMQTASGPCLLVRRRSNISVAKLVMVG